MTLRSRTVQHSAVLVVVLFLITAAASSRAQELAGTYTPRITQYAHTAWRLQDAAFAGTPLTIAQTTDGYIWVGTESGLLRFDGVQFLSVSGLSVEVDSLLGSRDGALWVGTTRGVQRVGGPNLYPVPKLRGRVNGLAEDSAGNIWLARTRIRPLEGPLCKITSAQSRCFGPADQLPCMYGQAVLVEPSGEVWLNDGRGICEFPHHPERIPISGSGDPQAAESISGTLLSSATGGLLVDTATPAGGTLLEEFASGHWHSIPVRGLDKSAGEIEALVRASDGSLWAGTIAHGLYHIHNGQADHFGTADGLSGDSINGILQDQEGSIWVVTSNGVDRFQVPKVLTFSTREGLVSDHLTSVAAAQNGDLWIATNGGLIRMHDGHFSTWSASAGLPGNVVRSLLVDRKGTLWLGVNSDLLHFANGNFKSIAAPDGSPVGTIEKIMEDASGTIWVHVAGPFNRLFQVTPTNTLDETRFPYNFRGVITPAASGGLWLLSSSDELLHDQTGFKLVSALPKDADYNDIASDRNSALVPTKTGLLRWNGKIWSSLSSLNGLPCSDVRHVLVAQNYGWWLSLRCGYTFVPSDQVQAWKLHPDLHLRVSSFDVVDGAIASITPFSPSAAVTPDGRAWFVTHAGLQMIDLAHLPSDALPPPVHITDFVADNKSLGVPANLRLAPLTRRICIYYNGLSFVTPQKVEFKYRLYGVDNDWQNVGSRREAFYMNLPPGNYLFQVIARNSDGVWNTVGDSLRFTLPPTFYQTKWFLALDITIALLVLFFIFRIRINRATELLDAQHRERLGERDRIARELHDTLLQGFQGLMLRLQTSTEMIPPSEPVKAVLQDAIDRADLVLIEGRNSVRNLRAASSGTPSLSAELERVGTEYGNSDSPSFEVLTIGLARPINPVAYDELFAIGREAIVNAFRHAGANKITVSLRFYRRQFLLVCRDDGCGVALAMQTGQRAAGHFGLVGMRERARKLRGELTVLPAQPHGTVVTLKVPARIVYPRKGWSISKVRSWQDAL